LVCIGSCCITYSSFARIKLAIDLIDASFVELLSISSRISDAVGAVVPGAVANILTLSSAPRVNIGALSIVTVFVEPS